MKLKYGISNGTKNINRFVKRHQDNFSKEIYFRLTQEEYNSLRFQNGTLKEESPASSEEEIARGKHKKYWPYVFT